MDKIQKPKHKRRLECVVRVILGLLAMLAGVLVAGIIWYSQQVVPVNVNDRSEISIEIESAATPRDIAELLQEQGVIRSSSAFVIYARIHGVGGSLQAGKYSLSPSLSVSQIIDRLVGGRTESVAVTFYPGATLVDNVSDSASRQDITTSLLNAGFSSSEIEQALKADYSEYDDTLFQGKPQTADLEGYIYGDTYHISSSSTAEDAIRMALDEFWDVIESNDLVSAFESRGLSLYQGITLASIIQKEAIGNGDEAGIAQVFLTRLEIGMLLGSDVTYQYIADKTGVERDPALDSPYNTRVYTGLPPGPISTPGLRSLLAVANPDDTDYLYFLSGDDDVTYFAETLDEHEANIQNHCQEKCKIL